MQRIRSKRELEFYILADRIMAGCEEWGLKQILLNKIAPPNILNYLKHLRCCQYYKHQRGLFDFLLYTWHWIWYQRLGVKLGFSIGYDALGYGVHIPHYGTIVVNNQCRIGNYCVLHTSTCIGGNGKVIGDGLYVGSGAMIMGPIKLGNGVSVASQSLVNKSFADDNVLLAGSPAVAKKPRRIWYEEDGSVYLERVKRIEKLKAKYGIES